MAYDEGLAQIIEDDLLEHEGVTSKKMFGGLCFLNRGHMLCGVHKSKDKTQDLAMFRVGPAQYDTALSVQGVSELSFTGRAMTGLVETPSDIFEDDDRRRLLLNMALDFTGGLPPK